MKISLSILGLALLAFFSAPAQVTVEVALDQQQFLPGESLPVAVKVTNRSGQPLHLGADAGWLTFDVESEDGFIVMKNAEVPVLGAFDLGSSEVATKRVDLAPYFDLRRQGRYHIIATVRIKDWNAEIASPKQYFDVINGATLWSQDFGVPAPAGATNRPPEVRKYTLEKANYLHSQLRMYVLVSDQSGSQIYKVTAVGPMVGFSQPEPQLDRFSNLHVLYQSGASSFIYSVINPGGDIVQREIYDYRDTRPRLGANAAGDIVVIGGARRVRPSELPVVKPPDELPPPAKP
ncbi:MAG TPA: hypothetical protein VGH42_13360 [Verrucomicrobiae bacterium]|jgi:hypothetical protein